MDLAGSKLRKKRGAQMNEGASAPVASFAVAQLEKMGWTQGTGLGKKRNGISTHIKVNKRRDEAGLGTEKAAVTEIGNEWWKDSLGDTLSKLGGGTTKGKTFTDEELFEATGGARFGMRAGKTRNQAKWRRTENAKEAPKISDEEAKEKKKAKKDRKKRKKEANDGAELSSPEKKEKKRLKKEKKRKKKEAKSDESE